MGGIKTITRGAVIASLYVALVLVFAPISFGPVQFRVAEALTLLPYLWFEAVPGLFVGCLIANIFGGMGLWDIFLGSTATLAAAVLTYLASNRLLAATAPVVVNGLIVGWYLSFLADMPVLLSMLYVAFGEAAACYALGIPMIKLLERKFIGQKQ
ncbi:MAG: QueT transporter family protein [Synergistaceae bacterium]|nr:QueT transporter family protein [Synergistaceae bacterium]